MGTDYETLLEFGVPEIRAKKALKATGSAGLQAALDWLEKHQDDPNIDKEDVQPEPEASTAGISAEGAHRSLTRLPWTRLGPENRVLRRIGSCFT